MTTYHHAADIAAEVSRRIATILIADGFETDIGRDVMRGRRKIPGDDQPPCTIITEGADDVKDQAGRMPSVILSQAYIVDGFDKCDPDNPNDKAHAMIRDIKKVLFADGSTLGETVKLCRYLGRDIGPRPDGVALVQARVMIEVEYVEDLRSP